MGPKGSQQDLTQAAFERRALGFLGLAIVTLGLAFCLPPIPQHPGFHAFADGRTMLGVPNFLNVASNLPFVVVGLLGLGLLLRHDAVGPAGAVLARAERWPFLVLFAGVLLTGFGSAYYHLAPDNDRLVWDRLPMTVAFMGLFASMIGERIGVRAGAWLLWPLVWLGVASVLAWHLGERRGAGDLRLYGFVQFYPLLTIPLLIYLFPARYTHAGGVFVALGWYLLAKVLELGPVDHGIYSAGQLVSGHTLKHLAAALGAYWLFRMVKYRRPAANAG
ncbi:MAG TPA: hypothetical protein VFE78_34565 [Gemmataceae bacterium]|jgi:hypothetical protein|nr:hypothetical protein [Gemmataceae bacterium]